MNRIFFLISSITLFSFFLVGCAGPLGPYLRRADYLSDPLDEIVPQALQVCSASPKIDAIDEILLTKMIPYIGDPGGPDTSSHYDATDKVRGKEQSTYQEMKRAGASHGEAMGAAGQQAGYAGYGAVLQNVKVDPRIQARKDRKSVILFRAYYKQGKWFKAAHEAELGYHAPGLLWARAYRRAIEEGTFVVSDEPGELLDESVCAKKALKYYNESLGNTFLSPAQQEQVVKEAKEWEQKVNAGNFK